MKKNYLYVIAAALFVAIDQILKVVVVDRLAPDGSVVFIKGVLNWTYIENHGAAFSILEGMRWLLIPVTTIMVIVCVYLLLSKRVNKTPAMVSLMLIAAGGAGNLIDRIFRGFVVDYIDLNFKPFDGFAIFNFADCLVVVGTFLLLIYILFEDVILSKRKEKQKELPDA